jgi:prevent-host-death family protein
MSLPVSIAAGKFKAECLHLMDEVAQNQQELIITKHGKPVAKLVPIINKPASLFGCMADTVVYLSDDLISPIDEEWNAQA